MSHPEEPGAEPARNPDISLTIDIEAPVVDAGLEFLGLGRIGGGETDHEIGGVRDPDAILLVDGEVERPEKRLAWLGAVAFADDPALGPITLGEVDELALRDAQSPHVATRRDDDALHQAELAVEGDALGGCQRLAVLVEHRNRLAAVGGEPSIVVGIDRRAKSATLHPATGEARCHWREGLPVRREFGGIALP